MLPTGSATAELHVFVLVQAVPRCAQGRSRPAAPARDTPQQIRAAEGAAHAQRAAPPHSGIAAVVGAVEQRASHAWAHMDWTEILSTPVEAKEFRGSTPVEPEEWAGDPQEEALTALEVILVKLSFKGANRRRCVPIEGADREAFEPLHRLLVQCVSTPPKTLTWTRTDQ